MHTRRTYDWQCTNRTVRLGEKTLVMGILNVTPDSFSDGGNFVDPEVAVEHALKIINEGADIIDIGGESTRPGATPVSIEEEICRTVPVISQLREKTEVLISIDTMKAETAFQALEAGADIINDVSGFEFDDRMVDGTVGVTDLLAAIGVWGPCSDCAADLDGDGIVGVTDLLAIIGQWGDC